MSVYQEVLPPICEGCEADAEFLRLDEGVWTFWCEVHRGWRPCVRVRDVWGGWTPDVQDPAWAAAAAACRGVRLPLWRGEHSAEAWRGFLAEGWVVHVEGGAVYATPPE